MGGNVLPGDGKQAHVSDENKVMPLSTDPLHSGVGEKDMATRRRDGRDRRSLVVRKSTGVDLADEEFLSTDAPLPDAVWIASLVLGVFGIFTPNPTLTLGSFLVVPVIFKLLWRKGEAPLLLFCCLSQWLQIATPVFLANVYGHMLEAHSGIPLQAKATLLGLLGVVVFAFGVRLALRGCDCSIGPKLEREVTAFPTYQVFLAWVAASLMSVLVMFISRVVPGLFQIIQPIAELKTGCVFVLGYAVFRQRRGYSVLFLAVVVEFLAGTVGFFGGFRTILNVLLLLFFTLTRRWNLRVLVVITTLVGFMLLAGAFWNATKPDYRAFLNQGSGQQEVVVPIDERLKYLATKLETFGVDDFFQGLETTLRRVGYTDFFAFTLNNVPEAVPYQRGQLWLQAVTHVLMPRMFFPDKAEVNDSYRTRQFSGEEVAGPDEGPSIGLGYMTESYVDFGPYLMFVPVFLLALVLGWAYRYFVLRPGVGSWGYVLAFAMPFVMPHMFETSNIKIVGRIVACAIIFVPLDYYFGRHISAWLRGERRGPRRPRGRQPRHAGSR